MIVEIGSQFVVLGEEVDDLMEMLVEPILILLAYEKKLMI